MSDFGKWLDISSMVGFKEFKQQLEKGIEIVGTKRDERSRYISPFDCSWKTDHRFDVRKCYLAYIQLNYKIIVDYVNQKFELFELSSDDIEYQFDLFEVMPFCYGNTEYDKSFLCAADIDERMAFTANHPFLKWLIKNAESINNSFPLQFDQIVWGLQFDYPEELIELINRIKEMISKSSFRCSIDISDCPELTINDFWVK